MFTERENLDHVSYLAPYEEIKENDYNLSPSTYIEALDNREAIDIDELNAEIDSIIAQEDKLKIIVQQIVDEMRDAYE